MHTVSDGRRGSCQVCLRRLVDQSALEERAEQQSLFQAEDYQA